MAVLGTSEFNVYRSINNHRTTATATTNGANQVYSRRRKALAPSLMATPMSCIPFAIAEREKKRYPMALLFSGTAHYMLGNNDQALGYANQFHSIQPGNVAGG